VPQPQRDPQREARELKEKLLREKIKKMRRESVSSAGKVEDAVRKD
jgi:hypothetical protein